MKRILFFCLIFSVLCILYGCVSAAVQGEKEPVTLEVENSTPFEVNHLYAKTPGENEWGEDLLHNKGILPFGKTFVRFPDGLYELKAEILVHNEKIIVKDSLDFKSGKQYVWVISEENWAYAANGKSDYRYLDSYEYLGTYEYMDSYEYMDNNGL
jgi:hypothetical protein